MTTRGRGSAALSKSAMLLAARIIGCAATVKTAQLVFTDTERSIRHRDEHAAKNSPEHPPVLFLPMDGVNRELPKLTDLLAGEGNARWQALSALPRADCAECYQH